MKKPIVGNTLDGGKMKDMQGITLFEQHIDCDVGPASNKIEKYQSLMLTFSLLLLLNSTNEFVAIEQ